MFQWNKIFTFLTDMNLKVLLLQETLNDPKALGQYLRSQDVQSEDVNKLERKCFTYLVINRNKYNVKSTEPIGVIFMFRFFYQCHSLTCVDEILHKNCKNIIEFFFNFAEAEI